MAVGDALLGRVIDAGGNPLDGRGPLRCDAYIALSGAPINPMERHPISEPIDAGVRAINAAMTVGRGQSMGLPAGSGVGRSEDPRAGTACCSPCSSRRSPRN